jgi:hypothetical protein
MLSRALPLTARTVAALAAAAAVVVPGAAPASADPTNSPQAITIVLSCNAEPTTIVIPTLNGLTPRIVVEGNGVLIPVSISITITDLTTNELVFTGTTQRAYGAQDAATVECSETHTRIDDTTGHLLEVHVVSENHLA